MKEHVLFLTGHLAKPSLERVLGSLQDWPHSYEIRDLGVQVAALMTTSMVARRIGDVSSFDRIVLPGLCRGDTVALANQLGVRIERGSKDLKDLPKFLGGSVQTIPLDQHNTKIFAEITDASTLTVAEIAKRASQFVEDGADVIDLGFLPDTQFPHLEEAIQELLGMGIEISVDTLEIESLRRADRAGVHYVLSLTEENVHWAETLSAVPILIPDHEKTLASLYRSIEFCERNGCDYIADSILDPVHFGFTNSIVRYQQLRKDFPASKIMMGIGNVTELLEADTSGINALLFGIISELSIDSVLTTQVSLHARSVIRESDLARKIMWAAKQEHSVPKGYSGALSVMHDRSPYIMSEMQIEEIADMIRDPSYRVYVTEGVIHTFNRDVHIRDTDPFAIYKQCKRLHDDASHAFYLGVELARAQIACQLGKAYRQDNPLDWGVAVSPAKSDNPE